MSKRKLLINVRRIVGTSTLKSDIARITPDVDKSSIDGFRGIGVIPPRDDSDQNCTTIYDKDSEGVYTFADIIDGTGPKVVDLGDNAGKTKNNVCDRVNTIHELREIHASTRIVLNPDGLNVTTLGDFL